VPARFDAPADEDTQHEHDADDDGAAEEQIEDLTTVEADLDLVLVQLGRGAGHTPRFSRRGSPGQFLAVTATDSRA
jgi:hypothetical protein